MLDKEEKALEALLVMCIRHYGLGNDWSEKEYEEFKDVELTEKEKKMLDSIKLEDIIKKANQKD